MKLKFQTKYRNIWGKVKVKVGHAVAQLVETLRYNGKVAGLIPISIIRIVH